MRVLAVGLVSLVVAVASATPAESTAPAGSTLVVSMPSAARGFAVGPSRIAWIDAQRRLHVVRLASGRRTTVAYTEARFVNRDALFGGDPGLAFAGSRPVWADAWAQRIAGESLRQNVYQRVYATTATGRLRTIARLNHEDDGGGGPGGYLLAIAGDASGGAYSWTHGIVTGESYRRSSGGVWTLADGISRRVPNLPPAWTLARSNSRLAFVPLAVSSNTKAPEPDADNVVIATVGGRIIATFRAKREVQALALTPRYLFVEVASATRGGGVEIHDATTGKLLRWLPGRGGPAMSASGRYAVFFGLDSVWLLDGATGAIRRVARTDDRRSHIIQAAIYRRAVWWAVATKTPGSRGDTNNPADFVTSIHKHVLPD